MRPTHRTLREQATTALNEISSNHTKGLLIDEEFLIRNVLLHAITQLDLNVTDECSEFWSRNVSEARGRLSFEAINMQLRKHIIDKIETVLGSLKTVHWNKTQKEAFVKSIKNEMQKCVSELMNSKRKRQEDREKAKAATQSSLDIPLFDDEKIKTDPEDLRRSERNPKPPFKRVSNSGRFGKR